MIGMQVGPGFFESFKKGGVTLNLLSATAILLNILVMFGCYYLFFDTSNPHNLPMMVGTLYGAVTNTPGLGAANEALLSVFPNGAPSIANGYACAYPLGVVGIIGATILIKYITRVNLTEEEAQLNEEEAANPHAKPHNMHLRVENAYIAGRTLREVSEFLNRDIVCSRLLHDGEVSIPNSKTTFEVGDELLVVCAEADAEAIKAFIGPEIEAEWDREKDEVQHFVSKRIIVTRPEMNGKTLGKRQRDRKSGSAGMPMIVTSQFLAHMLQRIQRLIFPEHRLLNLADDVDALHHSRDGGMGSRTKVGIPTGFGNDANDVIMNYFVGVLPLYL